MTPFEMIEKKLGENMIEGQMHATLRDIGRLAGGFLASGELSGADLSALERIACARAVHPNEAADKWRKAVDYGRQQPVEQGARRERSPSPSGAFGWDDPIFIGPEKRAPKHEAPVIDARWVEPDEIPDPAPDWSPGDMIRYLEAVFEPDEHIGIVADAWHQEESDRWLPKKGIYDRSRTELVDAIRACNGVLGNAIGDPHPIAGAWVRINPVMGGNSDAHVTTFRHSLIEADGQDLGKQLALIRELKLPCSAIVHSGGKSIHAIVRVEAADYTEYRARVDRLYKICAVSGLKVDTQNRNPSRLSRLPGVARNGKPQYLIATQCGFPTWDEWTAWVEETRDDLPDPEPLDAVFNALPPLATELITGVLRAGHKMRLTGPSKAGKSFALIELAIALAEGRDWFGLHCKQGPVLYLNLELDRASCLHRFHDVYQALSWKPDTISAIDVWNLRGHAVPLDKLAPKLIRRASGKGYVAVIIDPIYKIQWGDENDAGDVARFCNQLDRICHDLKVACIDAHHHSKGTQGGKRSIDRGSGSGVFGRDPDAVLDMIGLNISEDRRAELADSLVYSALLTLALENDLDLTRWPEEKRRPAPAALSTFQHSFPAMGPEAATAVYEARAHAARLSGWRMEGTLREFAAIEPRRVWFDYPIHRPDTDDLLVDAKAEGEEPPWAEKQRNKDAQRKEKAEALTGEINEAVKAAGGLGLATVRSIAESLGLNDDTVRKRLTKHPQYRYHNGMICLKPEPKK